MAYVTTDPDSPLTNAQWRDVYAALRIVAKTREQAAAQGEDVRGWPPAHLRALADHVWTVGVLPTQAHHQELED